MQQSAYEGKDIMKRFKNAAVIFSAVIIFACSLFICGMLRAEEQKEVEQQKQQAEGVAGIQFDELAHDFGKSLQNQSLRHTFVFKNVGTGVLNIEKVKAG